MPYTYFRHIEEQMNCKSEASMSELEAQKQALSLAQAKLEQDLNSSYEDLKRNLGKKTKEKCIMSFGAVLPKI